MTGAHRHARAVSLRRFTVSKLLESLPNGLIHLVLIGLMAFLFPLAAFAQQRSDSSRVDQSLDDAWWTGPMLAASPNTLPRGHILIEPYLFDVRSAHADGFGTLTYLLYGLVDRLTVGSIINAGWTSPDDGASSSGIGLGDLTLQASYRLTQFHKGSWVPTTAVVLQETLPFGKYDQLGNRPSDGFGSGAYTTAIALYSQSYFWLPNHRILRMRLNLTQGFSNSVNVQDVSVYGTSQGFRGTANPGDAFSADAAAEYSVTRRWVLALDVQFNHNWNTRVSGYDSLEPGSVQNPPSIVFNSGARSSFAFAPAIEYSWKPTIGVLLGTRFIPSSRTTTSSITPALAINIVR
jgi:hypothetical protein